MSVLMAGRIRLLPGRLRKPVGTDPICGEHKNPPISGESNASLRPDHVIFCVMPSDPINCFPKSRWGACNSHFHVICQLPDERVIKSTSPGQQMGSVQNIDRTRFLIAKTQPTTLTFLDRFGYQIRQVVRCVLYSTPFKAGGMRSQRFLTGIGRSHIEIRLVLRSCQGCLDHQPSSSLSSSSFAVQGSRTNTLRAVARSCFRNLDEPIPGFRLHTMGRSHIAVTNCELASVDSTR